MFFTPHTHLHGLLRPEGKSLPIHRPLSRCDAAPQEHHREILILLGMIELGIGKQDYVDIENWGWENKMWIWTDGEGNDGLIDSVIGFGYLKGAGSGERHPLG